MPKTAARKLTSEERCWKAFDAWEKTIKAANSTHGWNVRDSEIALFSWDACWKYLQSNLKEYIES
jgi:hypothetical protein